MTFQKKEGVLKNARQPIIYQYITNQTRIISCIKRIYFF